MLKFIYLTSLFLICLNLNAQRARFYKNPSIDFNQFTYFYIQNNPVDAHDINSPFINKMLFTDIENKCYSLYYELSLKNMTIIDGESINKTILVNIYEGIDFDNMVKTTADYKNKKIKTQHLMIDILDGSNNTLIFRGWIALKNKKAISNYDLYQKAIYLILYNFKIDPVIIE